MPAREKEGTLAISPMDGEFAASLAHEINNPLDCLLSLLHLVEGEAEFTEQGREHLQLAHAEIRRISQIIHRAMNDFRSHPQFQPTDVPRLFRSVVNFYQSRMQSHAISVICRYCEKGELTAHPILLRQMFSNLLLNADATPYGGRVRAHVSSVREWKEPRRSGLRITIADNGTGIASKDLPKITDAFFTTKGNSGTGLGLAVVKETIDKHRGVLHVRTSTKPGRSGSVFSVFLPAE
ncbi:MAG TPA: HAMP domain-containing sensor histidine kinase [Candidatus Koribacter sp.]|jgi:signal transduction histidine kinase